MDKSDLPALKELAEKATQEPWNFVQKWDEWENYVGPESWVDDGQWIGVFKYSRDADFVRAANPQTILALIAEIERLQDELESVQNTLEDYRSSYQLEKEANWLAAAQNWDVPAEEPTRCPEGKEPPNGCIGVLDCTQCWRDTARKAVGGQGR